VALEKYFTELPPVKAEKEELQQTFINIITNALQAIEGKGRLTLSTLHKERRILVTIRDNGPGIPQGYQSNVFDPFFTTKRQGSGSGLGLTIAHRTVQKYGGRIELHSTPGEGTVFTIDLPVDSQR